MTTKQVLKGSGIAMLAAIGGYWLYEKGKGKPSSSARGWMLKMKGDVMEKLEDIKDVNREAYHQVVDQVAGHYQKVKKVGKEEMAALVHDLKEDWEDFGEKIISGNGEKK